MQCYNDLYKLLLWYTNISGPKCESIYNTYLMDLSQFDYIKVLPYI